jgi:putative endopeptidase
MRWLRRSGSALRRTLAALELMASALAIYFSWLLKGSSMSWDRRSGAIVSTLSGLLLAAAAYAQSAGVEAPLSALPYIPGLDPSAMDRTADPCVDFYQYSCGGWRRNNPIPADQANWSVYGKLYEDNQRFLWGILDNLSRTTSERTDNQQKIGDYFAACMDEAAIEGRGLTPLRPFLDRIEELKSKGELPAVLADLHRQFSDGEEFFRFGPNQDYADSTQVIAFADAGGLGLPDRDYYTDTDHRSVEIRSQYREHLIRVFQLLGDGKGQAERNAAAVMKIETSLARASLKRVDRRDPHKLFHKMAMAAAQKLTPGFDWSSYLTPLGLAPVSSLNVSEPRFYGALNQALAMASLDDIKTYLRWHLAHAASPALSSAFEAERFAFFDHTLRGVATERPRWKRCVRQVDDLLGEALGQEFVARTFGPALKDATLRMTIQIEQAMRADIEGLTWMSDPTKHHALVKLDAIVNKIGYPDRWRDYSRVEIRRDDYFGNVLRATEFESQRQLAKIGKPLDRSEWMMTPPTVNAYFDPQMNDINFPAGVLQPPLYDPAMDDAPNYGNTGGTIGHELTHAFDDEGRQFDAKGNLSDWWTIADAQKFKQRAQCIVDQYAQYVVVDEIHINSRLTLGEDVADLGGLILARMAWTAQTAGRSLESRDGLTPEQRFFVGYAQWACENDRPENLRMHTKTDPHSPGKYRVNGLVVNMPEFEQAFMCKAGQPMVSAHRCRVW